MSYCICLWLKGSPESALSPAQETQNEKAIVHLPCLLRKLSSVLKPELCNLHNNRSSNYQSYFDNGIMSRADFKNTRVR